MMKGSPSPEPWSLATGWKKRHAYGRQFRLNDVKETLTDSNGAWTMEGPSGVRNPDSGRHSIAVITLLTGTHYTNPPHFIIYKPGYCSIPDGFGVQACKFRLKPQPTGREGPNEYLGNGQTAELPKLLDRTDRQHAIPEPLADSNMNYEELLNKQKKLLELINEEQRNLGLRETDFHKIYKSVYGK